jgi:hypothetical protein
METVLVAWAAGCVGFFAGALYAGLAYGNDKLAD